MRTRKATQRERTRILDKELVPTWGNRPSRGHHSREVVHLVEDIAKRGARSVRIGR